ncbi:uncharacterized protein FN964_009754 isoform 2-T2 [Alca torda]
MTLEVCKESHLNSVLDFLLNEWQHCYFFQFPRELSYSLLNGMLMEVTVFRALGLQRTNFQLCFFADRKCFLKVLVQAETHHEQLCCRSEKVNGARDWKDFINLKEERANLVKLQ